jgi:hypothetical protein
MRTLRMSFFFISPNPPYPRFHDPVFKKRTVQLQMKPAMSYTTLVICTCILSDWLSDLRKTWIGTGNAAVRRWEAGLKADTRSAKLHAANLARTTNLQH